MKFVGDNCAFLTIAQEKYLPDSPGRHNAATASVADPSAQERADQSTRGF